MYSESIKINDMSDILLALSELEREVPHIFYNWDLKANGGGLDCGVFMNFDFDDKIIEISNQPISEYYYSNTDPTTEISDIIDKIKGVD